MRSTVIAALVAAALGAGLASLHAEPKGPQSFPPTREELAAIRGFTQEQEELQASIKSFVGRAARDRHVPEDRFGFDPRSGKWVLAGDVAQATSSN